MKLLFIGMLAAWVMVSEAQSFEIYISDAENFNSEPWQIMKVDENGESPSTFINTNLNWPQDILFLEGTNTVLISNLGSNRITRHNAETGAFIDNFATGINCPTRIKMGPDSLFYVLQWNGPGLVKRYRLDGTDLGDFTNFGVNQSIGLDWDAAGNLYVTSYNGSHVRRFDPTGINMGLFINSNLSGPTNIWFNANEELLASNYDGSTNGRFNSSGDFLGTFISGFGNSEGWPTSRMGPSS